MVYESVKRYSLKGMNDLLRVLMENVDDALFDLSEKVDNDRDRTMYFDAMREIRLKRQAIVEGFDQQLQDAFGTLILNRSAKPGDSVDDELSLVDQQEVEDSLAMDAMISKARPSFEDDLFAIKERLKVVLHRKQIEDDLNPFDPKAICNSFHEATQVIDSSIEVRLIFYKLFERFVMSKLGEFYTSLNHYFIDKGVLPELRASEERLNQTSRFMANRRRDSSDTANPDLSVAPPSMEASGESIGSDAIGSNIFNLLQNAVGQPGTGFAPGNAAGSAPAGSVGGSMPGAAAAAIGGAYFSALNQLQNTNLQPVPVISTDPQEYKSEIQQQLVSFRQAHAAEGNEADNQTIDIISMLFDFFFDDEALPDPVKVLIGRLQIPILKVAILDKSFFNLKKHPARKLLDSISKASLGWNDDPSREQKLIDKIEKTVDYLLAEFETDIAVFDNALSDFQAFIDKENQAAEKNQKVLLEQEQEKEDELEKTRQLVGHVVERLASKHDFSLPVVDFLEGTWKQVLYTTCLAEGEQSNHWRNLKKISSTLIWTLIPKHSEDEKKKLLQTLPPLLRALSRGMDLIKIDKDNQNQVFQMLVAEHSKVMKQTSKNIVTRVDDQTVWPEDKMAAAFAGFNQGQPLEEEVDLILTSDETGEISIVENPDAEDLTVTEINHSETKDVIRNLQDFTDSIINGSITIDEEIVLDSIEQNEFQHQKVERSDEFVDRANQLDIGSWVEFEEEDKRKLNAKLSWKSNVTGKLVFVNRQGAKVRNMTVFGFATELRARRARLIETVSVFDRAINSFMSTIHH